MRTHIAHRRGDGRGKFERERVPQNARVEAKTAIARSASSRNDGGSVYEDAGPARANQANQRFEERAVDA